MREEQLMGRETWIAALERSLAEEKDEKEVLRKERDSLVLLNEKLSHTVNVLESEVVQLQATVATFKNVDIGHNGTAQAEQEGVKSAAVTDGAAQALTTSNEEELHAKLREMEERISVEESLVRQREEEMEMMHDDINSYAKSLQQHFSAIVAERDQRAQQSVCVNFFLSNSYVSSQGKGTVGAIGRGRREAGTRAARWRRHHGQAHGRD